MGISIAFNGGGDAATTTVSATSDVRHVITDEEVAAWGIGDAALKAAVAAYFGKAPNDAYLHSPTPWDDLYKRYGWSEVTTHLAVQSARIKEVTFEPILLAKRRFENDSTVKVTYSVGVTDSVTETTQTSWSTSHKVSMTQLIRYGLTFLGTGGGGETSFGYEHAWGEGGSETHAVTVGSTTAATVTLDPGQAVIAELVAQRGKAVVEVVYSAFLTGSTAVNYNPTFKDHHFWALPIDAVMAAAGIQNGRTITTTIEVGYYSDATVNVHNPRTMQHIDLTVPALAVAGT